MKSLLRINPEFARNIWLEFSLQRLIITPVVIILLAFLVVVNIHEETYRVLHYGAMGVFVFITMIWGLKSASDSVLDEYNDKTWDWQRMTIIGPWRLAWGKLFGSTSFQWYGGLMCMVIFFVTALDFSDPGKELKSGLILIISAITLHGIMILFSLMMVRKGDGRAKIKSNRIFILGILIVSSLSQPFSAIVSGNLGNKLGISWYGIHGQDNITLLSIIFYGAWVIAGLYRSMRAELQYTDRPKYWITFLASNIIFVFGYFAGNAVLTISAKMALTFILCFVQALIMLYALAITETKDVVNFSLILDNFKKRNWDSFLRNIPLWPLTFGAVVVTGFFAVIFSLFSLPEIGENFRYKMVDVSSVRIIMLYIAVLGFVVRDLSILLLLNFSQRSRRADGAMVLYMGILYVLLPMVARQLQIGAAFYPAVTGDPVIMAVVPIIEAGIAVVFLVRRWKSIQEWTHIEAVKG